MTTARIDWSAAFAAGFEGVVCVLIEGLPIILTPSGKVPTAAAVTSGTVDPAWWKGTGSLTVTRPNGSTFSPVLDVLDANAVWELYSAARPADGTADVEPVRFDLFDADGAMTAILSGRDARLARALTADITAASTAIPLDSVTSVPSSGYLHIGRECISYVSLTGTDANVTSRGLFGSVARAHVVGSGSRRPLVVADTYPRSIEGRIARVFLCKLVGTTLYDPTMVASGPIGAGSALTAKLMRWQVTIDSPIAALSRRFDKLPVRVTGYQHSSGFDTPLTINWQGITGLGAETGGGWSPNSVFFIRALDARAVALGYGVRVGHTGERARITATGPGGDITWSIVACWDNPNPRTGTTPNLGENTGILPECVMHLDGALRVSEATQWDLLPSTLEWTVSTPAAGRAYAALTADTDTTKRLFARISARDATSKTLTLQADMRVPFRLGYEPIEREAASRITKPTTATLGILATGDTALGALCALTTALDEIQGSTLAASVVDWDSIARVFASIPTGAITEARSFRFSGDEDSLLAPLIHEARLRGASLCIRRGLVSAFRPANFAATEFVVADLDEGDLIPDEPVEVVDGVEPVATAVRFTLPDGGSFTYRDTTSAAEYGEGKVIDCKALESATGLDFARLPVTLQGFAQQILGVLSEPQRIIRVVVGPDLWSLDTGDLVTFTHREIPDWRGNRGLSAALCQVMEARRAWYGGKSRVQLALRLAEDTTLAGYAPSALVGGIVGAVVTIDTTSPWGSNCFALDVDANGNAVTSKPLQGFLAGRKVMLSQLDAESPMADESFTIVSMTDTTVTLDGSPTAPMVTAAATRYGCLLRFAPWTDAAVTANQRAFLYIADDTAEDLGTGDAPKRWAA